MGASLTQTLYVLPLTIFLRGELGAGKTTFLQAFAEKLGIKGRLVSPTYALEQHYETSLGELVHIDLYRLSEKDAAHLLREKDDHAGIRCVEWSERLPEHVIRATPSILLSLRDEAGKNGRALAATFADIPLPTQREIDEWRALVRLPEHVIRHCDTVAHVARRLAQLLLKRHILIRPMALQRSAELHDLLRFVDFRDTAMPDSFAAHADDIAVWHAWKQKYEGLRHEAACAAFLRERGYAEIGRIVEAHGLSLPSPPCTTIEQKVLFYADKRVAMDTIVTLDERFHDFTLRYAHAVQSEQAKIWCAEARSIEAELFPEGVETSLLRS